MSTYEFKLPDIGEGVTEGEIVKWLVAQGEAVQEDQPMVEVMTDKATVTITAPKAGTIAEIRGQVGQTVPVHSVLVVFDLTGGAAPAAPAPAAAAPAALAKKDAGPAATAVGDIRESLPGMSLLAAPAPKAAAAVNGHAAASSYFSEKPLATPATRKLARDLGVDLRTVPPTGTQGRVTNDDVRRSQAGGAPSHAGTAAQAPARDANAASAPQQSPSSQAPQAISSARPAAAVSSTSEDTRQPLRGVRKRIFEGMSRSKHTAAHFTFV
ncbi:MAG: E3 binding domain-containing protein, partial [Myxococcales bacterium]|nr:E3 binding domain-containing protein [Myxococcales bacterium]